MRTNTVVEKRVFSLGAISEEEGLVLRTMLNWNDDKIKDMLKSDDLYWNDNMDEETAVKIGIGLRDQIFKMVDRA